MIFVQRLVQALDDDTIRLLATLTGDGHINYGLLGHLIEPTIGQRRHEQIRDLMFGTRRSRCLIDVRKEVCAVSSGRDQPDGELAADIGLLKAGQDQF